MAVFSLALLLLEQRFLQLLTNKFWLCECDFKDSKKIDSICK